MAPDWPSRSSIEQETSLPARKGPSWSIAHGMAFERVHSRFPSTRTRSLAWSEILRVLSTHMHTFVSWTSCPASTRNPSPGERETPMNDRLPRITALRSEAATSGEKAWRA
eukprot:6173922-Pleurochrysis_carterae.AAC.3